MHRLRIYDSRTLLHTNYDKSFGKAFTELHKLRGKLSLSSTIVEKTAYIYRKAQRHGIVRGRSIDCLLAASAYAACREMMIPKSPKEITEASNVSTKTLSKSYRLLIRELDLKVPRYLLGQYALKMASTACIC